MAHMKLVDTPSGGMVARWVGPSQCHDEWKDAAYAKLAAVESVVRRIRFRVGRAIMSGEGVSARNLASSAVSPCVDAISDSVRAICSTRFSRQDWDTIARSAMDNWTLRFSWDAINMESDNRWAKRLIDEYTWFIENLLDNEDEIRDNN